MIKEFIKNNQKTMQLVSAVSFLLYSIKEFFKKEKINKTYKHDFAVVNKSFKRDLMRSVNLYQSFEQFFENAEYTPFFCVVPQDDLDMFVKTFDSLLKENKINKMPTFITEIEVLKMSGEPDITFSGAYTMQVAQLCFGLTGIARHYFWIDSDTYFTRKFNKKALYKNAVLKTVIAGNLSAFSVKNWKKTTRYDLPIIGQIEIEKDGAIFAGSAFDTLVLCKKLLGNKKIFTYNNYVQGYGIYNSDCLQRMKIIMKSVGVATFTKLIKIVPMDKQWYGEYMLGYEKMLPVKNIFVSYSLEKDFDAPEDGPIGCYGITYHSVNHKQHTEQNSIRYIKPNK